MDNNIPKIIHYCWFGHSSHNELMSKCINSWKEHLPDYKIIEWSERNFDINSNIFVKEAYNLKKFAFVTDYVRLFVLYHYGGIYLDTDVEVKKNLDPFLSHSAFSGFEDEKRISTAIIGSKKNNYWIGELLEYYNNKRFVKEDGSLDIKTNVDIISSISENQFNIKLNNEYQEVRDLLALYPREYFCPKDFKTGLLLKSEKTYTIHHFNGSWLEESYLHHIKSNYIIYKTFGKKLGRTILLIKEIYKEEGLPSLFSRIVKKIG
ncbi:glycosyltransferase family 32 protein [Bacillus sp. MB2021]|uniref:glycosyltransferase family 32 protein n=1 Tax=Bacillus sp. MB2021 TaxID=1408303 RepID=UPI00068DA950|nr:glycosyltransferase [Bacillus sp. MB2021]